MKRTIILIICSILIQLSISRGSLPFTVTLGQKSTDEIIGAYNHLTICFALVRNILQVEFVRRNILGNVNLASLPMETQNSYKSLLQICDKALAQKGKIANLESSVEVMAREAEAEQTTQVLSSLLSTSLGNPGVLLSLIFSGESGDSQQMKVANTRIQELKAMIVQEVSDFEFQLSLARSKLSQANNIEQERFITTSDMDEYLEMQLDENAPEKYFSSLNLLYERRPAMYFVAYELGSFAIQQGRLSNAQRYFDSTVENTPTILNYNPLRVDARCFLGDILVQQTQYLDAIELYSIALKEDRGSVHALSGKALALHSLKRYTEAKPLYEAGLRIQPNDPTMHYNYACLLALLGIDQNVVLDELKRAFNSGFSDISHAKSDSDLAPVREAERFKELTQMRFVYEVDWNMFTPDILLIANQSEFNLTNVIIRVNYLQNDSQGWKTIIRHSGTRKQRLKRGETISLEAFNSTQSSLLSVELIIETEQGSIRVILQNNSGQLKLHDLEIR